MRSLDLNDTIAAIATTPGDSGIGIIRISGSNALEIADKIFSAKSKKNPSEFKNFTVHYGWIVDDRPSSIVYRPSTSIIDEVLLTVMHAPYSYTRRYRRGQLSWRDCGDAQGARASFSKRMPFGRAGRIHKACFFKRPH